MGSEDGPNYRSQSLEKTRVFDISQHTGLSQALFESLWYHFGCLWGPFVALCAPSGTILGNFSHHLGYLGVQTEAPCVIWVLFKTRSPFALYVVKAARSAAEDHKSR